MTTTKRKAAPGSSRQSRTDRNDSPAKGSPRFSPTTVLVAGCLLALLTLPSRGHAYNIDLPSYTRHTRDSNSMFGFSIALHQGKRGYPISNSLVVGAPKFDTSSYQQGVVEAGAVFKCGMNDGDCNLVKFDSSGNNRNQQGEVIDRKSFQWLGATVSTSRDNDLVVACAPRYVFHTMTPNKSIRYDPVGTCFTTRNFTWFREVSPCRTNNWGYHRQGSCQAGFSAAASGNGDRLYIGAPGSWYWQGQAYSISPDATFPYKPPFYQPFGTGGQTYSYDVTRPENQVYSTGESSSQDDDSYLGYSMATGDFNGDRIDDIAIGMPRGAGLLGKIVVKGWNMADIVNITGRQIGEYFGYALATSDVDGDGRDDLIIGAPMFSEHGNVEGKYDVGRVYILLQGTSDPDRWTMEHIRDGYNTKGRFGLSLTSLGDINRDGYGDFAVGAPYDGPEGRGVVYIFHGSANGPLPKPSQIIKSEDIVEGAPYPRTFGFALSGGVDMDGNTYPDLAVGAYASDQVFIFKSRPVAAVNAMTTFITPSKLINIETKNCQTVRDGKHVTCTDIRTCWSYTGEYLPRNLEFDVSWVLDAKKPKNPRMFFLLDEGKNIRNQSISLPYGETYCRNETVYLIDNVQDKLTPLEVETRYNLRSNRRLSPVTRRKREVLEPVIDHNREIVLRDAINIQKNCGADNICEPDLRLQITTVDKYLMGSPEPLSIDVLITNANEDAFEAAFYMIMPKDLDFKNVVQAGNKTETPITCTAPTNQNNYTLKCDIGNPLQGQRVAHFKVNMAPSRKAGMGPSYDFYMEANSTNLERPGSHFDNIIRKSIGIWVETDLAIEGTSLPDFQLYKASDFQSIENATKEEDLGPQVVHLYNIRNNGPSAIEEAVIYIHYPYETAAGDLLMYMTNQPETDGNIRCDLHTTVNTRSLVLDKALVRTSYLEKTGAVARSHGASSYASEHSTLHIDKSYGGATGPAPVGLGISPKVLTAEEKKLYEKDNELDQSGDASRVHFGRANEAAAAAAAAEAHAHAAGGVGGGSSSSSSHWSSSSSSGGGHSPSSVTFAAKNISVTYDSSGNRHVEETSTEYTTNLDRSGSRPNSGYHSQQHSANYQQAPGAVSSTWTAAGDRGALHQANQQQQSQQLGPHNARSHVQMASPVGSSSYQASYSSHGSPSSVAGGSGNSYRAPQQQSFQRAGSTATYNDLAGVNSNLDKALQGGGRSNSFQAGTLDLGTLNRGNVENELRQQHSGSVNPGAYGYQQSYASSSGYQPQSAGLGGASHFQQPSRSSQSGAKPYYGMEDEDYYDDENGQQGNGQWSHSSSSSSHRRTRRDSGTTDAEAEADNDDDPIQIDLNSPCKAAKCETVRCVAWNLGQDDGVWVAIRTRMVAKTMEKLASNVALNVSTMAVAIVTKLPYIGEPKDAIIKSHELFYKAMPEPTPVPDVVPLWVVVLAACAGALILLLLVFILYKCGFFNRNRPTDHSMERQPLRNGYHADEHL